MAQYRAIRPLFAKIQEEKIWFTERYFADDMSAATVIIDDDVSLQEASLIEPITSVLRSLLYNPPLPGDDVIILGAGPCGIIALQLLKKLYGVRTATVLDKNLERLKISSTLGADYIYDVATDFIKIEQLVVDSKASYAQYVFDSLPDITLSKDVPNTRTLAMKLLAPGGTYVVYGATEVEQNIDIWLILSKGLKLRSSAFDVRLFPMWRTANVLAIAKHVVSHQIISLSPIISHLADFNSPSSIKAAFEEHATNNRLKTMVSFSTSTEDTQLNVEHQEKPYSLSHNNVND
ncbi:MAG: zinc-binding dehydrogenase [Nostoc sp.]|uniref:zinc-binding dehydrogenase n=1 Tax=Nostoc sp. TaxID=1180 RepID=UPI002FF14097